ncbi:MarR family transcriptional regulator [Thaumasiovibrio subtropicus]|uniref:MarR family transcriptional regulator n=1 Tax=Thaumasiovibrio subtropicus TaxID=1891207 RepID=UPI000B35955D|nr:MarR family transcriptional regulator [Thaumasiovibrio subtropicus]
MDTTIERFLRLVNRVHEIESRPNYFGTEMLIHRAEIHSVEAIGDSAPITLMSLAHMQGVTKGAASQMVTKLVKKGLVKRDPSPHSKKEMLISLTEVGEIAYQHHADYHREMENMFSDHFGDELPAFLGRLNGVMTELSPLIAQFSAQDKSV